MIDEDFVVYGNHSIPFAKSGAINLIDVIERLDALRLGDSAFLREMCIAWHPQPEQVQSDKHLRRCLAQDQKRRLKTHNWRFEYHDCGDYTFIGPYEFYVELTKTHVSIGVWCSDPEGWFEEADDEDIAWRNNWREILRQIIQALGGDYALYFSDPDMICKLAIDSSECDDRENTNTPARRKYDRCVECHHKFKAPEKLDDCPICTVDRFEDLQTPESHSGFSPTHGLPQATRIPPAPPRVWYVGFPLGNPAR
jgi:hypothetical protein